MGTGKWAKEIDGMMMKTLSSHYQSLPLTLAARQHTIDYCSDKLGISTSQIDKILITIPQTLLEHNALCFLSIYDNGRVISCILGHGSNLLDAIDNAIETTRNQIKIPVKNSRIELCLLFDEKPTDISKIRLGIHALSIHQKNKNAYYKNSVPIKKNLDRKAMLEKLRIKAGITIKSGRQGDFNLFSYKTLQYTADSQGRLLDLYRGNSLLLQSEIAHETINNSFKIAKDFLKNSIKDRGDSYYKIYAVKKKISTEKTLTSITRIIGSIWQLSEITNTNKVHHEILYLQKAIANVISNYFITDNKIGYIAVDGNTHLGVNSLLLLTILSFNEKEFLEKEKILLINWIENQVSYDKSKFTSLNSDEELIYPAEAMLALFKLFEKSNEIKYFTLIESLFPYYNKLLLKTDKKIIMCSWFSKVYSKVFLKTKKIQYAEFVFHLNDYLLPYQIPSNFPDVDIVGSFSEDGNSRITATLAGSLLGAYEVAKACNEQSKMNAYKNAILPALRALIQLQYTPDNCSYAEALGGFKNSIFDSTIRIDNVQHAVFTLHRTLKLFFKQKTVHIY